MEDKDKKEVAVKPCELLNPLKSITLVPMESKSNEGFDYVSLLSYLLINLNVLFI